MLDWLTMPQGQGGRGRCSVHGVTNTLCIQLIEASHVVDEIPGLEFQPTQPPNMALKMCAKVL